MRNLINLVEEATKFSLTPENIAQLQQIRHECRVDNGGGGACHLVSEWIENAWGFERAEGSYHSADGRIICSMHLWNYTPDGSILDATADQFGEDDGIRLIRPDHPLFSRYAPRWRTVVSVPYGDDDDEYAREEAQHDEQNRLRAEHGQGWWLTDKTGFDAYHKMQKKLYSADRDGYSSSQKTVT